MGYEVLTAFFLEAGFLGIMLFGRKRVGDGLHYVRHAMVAIGTLISAFWILAANSWMQTPAGYAINADGQFIPADWWAVIFNPSLPLSARAHGARGLSSPPPSWSARSAPGTCCATATNRRRAHDVLDGDVDGGAGRADPDLRRRPARAQHARAPAGQDRRDGGPLGDAAGRAADPVRHARHAARRRPTSPSRSRSSARSSSRIDWNGEVKGLKDWPPRGPATRRSIVLDLPHHGGPRRADAGARPVVALGALSRDALHEHAGCCARRC